MFNFFGLRRSRCNNRNLIYNLVGYEKVREMIFDQNNILIDVRSNNEYNIMHVVNAVNNGCDTVEKVAEVTKAGAACGRCKALVQNVIDLKR